jgi:hypothetical protein
MIGLCYPCRSLNYTLQSLRSNVLDPLVSAGHSYAIYIHTWNVTFVSNPRTGERNHTFDPLVYRLLAPHSARIEGTDSASSLHSRLSEFTRHGDPYGEGARNSTHNRHLSLRNLLSALLSLRQVTAMWQDDASQLDALVYTRPDIWFFSPLQVADVVAAAQSQSPVVYTPSWGQYRGLNDRFAIGNADGMRVYGYRLDAALNYSQNHGPMHSESFLLHVMKFHNVETRSTTIYFARIRASGLVSDWPVLDESNRITGVKRVDRYRDPQHYLVMDNVMRTMTVVKAARPG